MAFPDSTWPFIKLMGTGCHITTFSGRGPRHPFRKALWGPPALQHTLCGVCHPENMGNWGSTWTQQLKHLHRLERNLYHNFRQEINAEVWKNVGFCVRVGELCLKKNKQTNKIPQKKKHQNHPKNPHPQVQACTWREMDLLPAVTQGSCRLNFSGCRLEKHHWFHLPRRCLRNSHNQY